MHPESLINIASIVLAAFLGLHFVFLRSAQRMAHRFLGAFLLATGISVMGAELGHKFAEDGPMEVVYRLIDLVNLPPVLLLYYAFAVTGTLATNHQRYRWLWLLVLAELGLALIAVVVDAAGWELQWWELVLDAVQLLSLPFGIVVLLLMLRILREHNRQLLDQFSDLENKQLRWLRWLAVVNLGFMLIWLIDDSLAALMGFNPVSAFIVELSLYATLANIVWMGFAGLRQPVIFELEVSEAQASTETIEAMPLVESETEQAPAGPSEADQQLFEQLHAQVLEQRLYTNPEATVRSLAAELDIRHRELSRLINQCHNSNFYHYINALRIHHFKELQADPANRNLSIVGLAREAGFKSKSTFYAAFKKLEGTTPLASGSGPK